MGLLKMLMGGEKEEPKMTLAEATRKNAADNYLAPGSEDDFDSHPDDPFNVQQGEQDAEKWRTMLKQLYGVK